MTRVVIPADARRSLERSRSAVRQKNTNTNNKDISRRPFEITLAVLGATKVGKSAMVSQFLWEGFVSEYRPTVEEFNWVEYDVGGGSALMLQVIDSSGSRDFLAMRHLYIRTGDAFMVVFAVDDHNSFDEAKKIIEEIIEERKRKVPIVLVANKRDLYDDISEWKVRGAYQYAYSRMIPILECTAKRQNEVSDAFHDVLERLRDETSIGITDMRKRRQSMPSTRAYSGIDVTDIETLKRKQKTSCTIS